MPHSLKSCLGVLVAALTLFVLPRAATAQGASTTRLYTYSVSLLGGLGGSIDESESGYDNSAIQLGFSVVTERSVKVSARVGRLGSIERMANLFETDVEYVTVSGEYTFGEVGYQSGMFVGLGAYRLEGSRLFTGEPVSRTTVGLTGGLTGDFDLTERLSILAELSFHGLTQGDAQFFATGLVGLSFSIK